MVRGATSEWIDVTSGVPQGSVLGPVLFQIFVNDINVSAESSLRLFADDARLSRKIDHPRQADLLQCDINNIQSWALKNEMSFKVQKCAVQRFGKSDVPMNYELFGETISPTGTHRDLGVLIDNCLRFDEHVSTICTKANRLVGMFRRHFTT